MIDRKGLRLVSITLAPDSRGFEPWSSESRRIRDTSLSRSRANERKFVEQPPGGILDRALFQSQDTRQVRLSDLSYFTS